MTQGSWAPSSDLSPARWLQASVTGFEGRVRDVVPGDLPAFARILHRPDQGLPDGRTPATWAEAAARYGTVVHPAVQWEALTRGEWNEPAPLRGGLDRLSLTRLRDALLSHSGLQECSFAVWPGGSPLPAAWQAAPSFRLPMRQYHLFRAPLASVVELSVAGGVQSPQLCWPDDHSWCVASEVDFDSTIVAGARDLVAALLDHEGLEVVEVGPDTSLQSDADTVNRRSR